MSVGEATEATVETTPDAPAPVNPKTKKSVKAKAAPTKAPPVRGQQWSSRSQGLSKATFLLKQVADPTRAAVLLNLVDGSRTVTDLCKIMKMTSQPALSHHLALLRSSEVVEAYRDGKFVNYSLAPKGKALAKVLGDVIAKDAAKA